MRLRVAISHVVGDRLGLRLHLQKMEYPLCLAYGRPALTRTRQKATGISAVDKIYSVVVA